MKGAITLESVSSDSIEDKGTRRVEMKCKECRKVNTYLLTYLLTIKLSINSLKEEEKKRKKTEWNGRKRGFFIRACFTWSEDLYCLYKSKSFSNIDYNIDLRIAQRCTLPYLRYYATRVTLFTRYALRGDNDT